MANNKQVQPSEEETVAAALNEQGYLFAQLIRENVIYGVSGKGIAQEWKCVACEYPVTSADGFQTRIDIVLRHAKTEGLHVCIECKRAHPSFKRWVFFDKDRSQWSERSLYFHVYRNAGRGGKESTVVDGMESHSGLPGCPVFNLYVEAATVPDKKAGATQAIEDALLQAIRGQTGLIAKQSFFTGPPVIHSIPVVVTTAQLLEADFDSKDVSLATGQIQAKDLKLKPLQFCAVNYHPNDEIAKTPHEIRQGVFVNIAEDMRYWQTRTVFVVQSESVIHFLNCLHTHFGRLT